MQDTFLTRFANILNLRAAAKATAEKTFLHTSASNNATLIIAFLQSHYHGENRFVSTGAIVAAMNQSQPHVLNQLKKLHLAGVIKCKPLPRIGKGRRSFGWSAKP